VKYREPLLQILRTRGGGIVVTANTLRGGRRGHTTAMLLSCLSARGRSTVQVLIVM